MKIYTVHSHPARAHDPERDPVLIEEGFCWAAFLLALPWALWRRLWLVALGYVAVFFVFGAVIERLGYDGDAAAFGGLALQFLFALQARDLQRWTLRRNGWRDAGVVAGDELYEAELRWFAGDGRA